MSAEMMNQLTLHDDLDTIILHLQGRFPGSATLSPALELKLQQMSDCRDLIRTYGSRVKVVKMMTSDKVSRSQAERIYNDTLFVYNTTQTSHRDFWIDIAMGQILETKRKALVDNDLSTAAKCDANIVKLTAQMTDAKDSELYKRINVVKRVIQFDPSLTPVTLPDNWEEQVEAIKNKAKSRDMSSFQIVKEEHE